MYLPSVLGRVFNTVGASVRKNAFTWASGAFDIWKNVSGAGFLTSGFKQNKAETKPKPEMDFAGEFAGPLSKLLEGLQHGFEKEGIFKGLKMPEFKLDRPELKFPEMPEIKLPEAYTPDFSALGRLVEGAQAVKLTDTAVYGSADHAKRVYEYARNMEGIQAGLRGEPKKEDLQQQQLKTLQGIEKNTRPGVKPQVANLSPT
jgi:hypothetical protein